LRAAERKIKRSEKMKKITSEIEIESFSRKTRKETLQKCAALYCEIFEEPPWNENDWTVDKVLRDMLGQTTRLGFCGLLAWVGEENVGFTWGYLVSKEEMREIASADDLDFLFENNQRIFYVDELGVGSPFRGNQCGAMLSRELIAQVRKGKSTSIVILRTDKAAQAARSLYSRLGFVNLHIRDGIYPNRTYWQFVT
jgi:ribosomal protein S18 acetylase RimI-like enzyme